MNQMTIFAGADAERLEAIARDIENTQAQAIIQIGAKLAEAHGIFLYRRDPDGGDGGFRGWVGRRLSFGHVTAYKLIAVAKSFGEQCVQEMNTFDREALYALAGPKVDPELREAVVEAAHDGTHITIDEANRIAAEMVATKTRELTAKFNADHQEIRDNFDLLRTQLDELSQSEEPDAAPPTVEDAVQMLLTLTGRKRLTDAQAQALACALGKPVSYGARTFPPVSPQDTQQAEQALRISSACSRALEYFATAPPPADVAAAMPDWLKSKTAALLPVVLEWLDNLEMLLRGN